MFIQNNSGLPAFESPDIGRGKIVKLVNQMKTG